MISKWKFVNNILAISFLALLSSCDKGDLVYTVETQLNPHEISPLTAMLKIKSEKPSKATIKVLGEIPVEQSFDALETELNIPVVGLYPGKINEVVLTLTHEKGEVVDTVKIETAALPNYFPNISINKIDRTKMEPGMHLCDLHYAQNGVYSSRPMIFDDNGDVRWYLDLSFFKNIIWPIQRIKNGNLLVGGRNELFEYDMLGEVQKRVLIDDKYTAHHEILELPDGNWLVPVKKKDNYIIYDGEEILSTNDFIVFIDSESGEILKEWDLAKHLDVDRRALNILGPGNWLHINGLAYDEDDKSIIVSGRNQGVAKISWDDELKWILAPKRNWGKAGRLADGPDTNPYLLTAVDSDGNPYNNSIQEGNVSAAEFDFPWGQHAPLLMPNKNIFLFDNGSFRNWIQEFGYSRAVEYKINENEKTVQQQWQFGKSHGSSHFSFLISDVDYLADTGNILTTFGYVLPGFGRITETSYPENEEYFDATLEFKTLNGNKTFSWGQLDIMYRSERFKLQY